MQKPLKLVRSEREILRAVRAAGAAGIRSRQLLGGVLDSIQDASVKVILSRMLEKGLLRIERYEPQADEKPGRPAAVYVESDLGKEVKL